jgi:hypothetical protein
MAIFTVGLLSIYYRRKASVRTTGSTTTVTWWFGAVYLQHARVGIIDHRPNRFFQGARSGGVAGSLPSVVGGLVSCPVIAVPTSVGYGASFHGLAALLGMLNSCASNVTVVNIDNGFGAGYVASLINRL